MWYTALGAVIAIVCASLLTAIFGGNDPKDVPPELMAPFVRKLIFGDSLVSIKRKDIKITTFTKKTTNFVVLI